MRPLVIGGALTKKGLYKYFGPHLTCRSPSRTEAQRDSIGTQKSEKYTWDTDLSGVQWEIPVKVRPTLGV
jgi:hypothetical protein